MFEGQMKDGKPDGYGRVLYNINAVTTQTHQQTNDSHYVGFFRNGKRNGKGTLHFVNGQNEQNGEWKDDEITQRLTKSQVSMR